MNIQFYCPVWGSENLPFEVFLDNVKSAGYDGVEMSLPLNNLIAKNKIADQLKKRGLKLIAQHWETTDSNYKSHAVNLEMRLRNLAAANPVFINSQTGKDYFSFEQNVMLIQIAEKVASETGVKIIHETHRGKFSFAAHVTKRFLDELPQLQLTLDISHWCNVAESFLDDQQEAVIAAIKRTVHIHSRVGHPQASQVNDPRAPEWETALTLHLNWWDSAIAFRAGFGSTHFTITTEFGPPPYLPVLAYTNQPLANQWEINVFMMNMLKSRYKPILS